MSVIIPGRFDLVNKKFTGITKEILDKSLNEYDYDRDNNGNKDLKFYYILDIGGNMIETISNSSISHYFIHITELFLINNEIKEIPEEINCLVNLKKLYLAKNKLTKICNIDKLINLEIFDVRANRISNITGIENNINLTSLSISNNNIANIDSIPTLLKLHSLFLFSCHVSNFELFVKIISERCPNLEKLLIESSTMLNESNLPTYRQTIKNALPKMKMLDYKKYN